MFDNIKNALSFTKGERVAIISLAAVMFLLIAANFFVTTQPYNVNFYLHNLDSIWALHESAISKDLSQTYSNQRQKSKPTSETKGQFQSQSSEFITNHRKAQSNKNVKNTPHNEPKSPKSLSISSLNINYADTIELKTLPGIGSFFAKKIVEYREMLGGFIEINQLLEIYAFDTSKLETITPYINIDSTNLRKINVNTDDFKTILRHPYIEYEDVKKIVNHRERRGFIKNWEEYLKIVERDIDKRVRIYLEF